MRRDKKREREKNLRDTVFEIGIGIVVAGVLALLVTVVVEIAWWVWLGVVVLGTIAIVLARRKGIWEICQEAFIRIRYWIRDWVRRIFLHEEHVDVGTRFEVRLLTWEEMHNKIMEHERRIVELEKTTE